MQFIRQLTAAGLAAGLISGCSWSDALITEIKSVPAASSFGYKEGYESGCKTAIAQDGAWGGFDRPDRTRDEARISREKDYTRGWDEGSANCIARYAGKRPPYEPPAR